MKIFKIKNYLIILFFVIFTNGIASTTQGKTNKVVNNKGEKSMEITKDYIEVRNVLNKYLEAGIKGKSSILRPYVHKDALMFGRTNGELSGGSVTQLFEYLDSHPAAKDLKAEIIAIDIVEGIAYAKIKSDNWNGASFTDMFLLVKENNEWKFLTKTFYTHN